MRKDLENINQNNKFQAPELHVNVQKGGRGGTRTIYEERKAEAKETDGSLLEEYVKDD